MFHTAGLLKEEITLINPKEDLSTCCVLDEYNHADNESHMDELAEKMKHMNRGPVHRFSENFGDVDAKAAAGGASAQWPQGLDAILGVLLH